MEEVSNFDFTRYDKKSWFKSALLGFFIGLGVIIPGISGSTIAIFFKLYDKLLYAIGNIFKKFKICFIFLLPIILGIIVGFVLGFFSIQYLLTIIPFSIVCLFAGLMCGSAPVVFDEIKNEKKDFKAILLMLLGLIIPISIAIISSHLSLNSGGLSTEWWQYPLCIGIGFVIALTQLIPGLSATAFLMSIGYYASLVDSLHLSTIKGNPMILLVYASLIVGFLIGLISISKLITFLLNKWRGKMFLIISGFVVGSIFAMFYNPEMLEVYSNMNFTVTIRVVDFSLGIVLFIVGFIITFLIYKYDKKSKTLQN